MMLRGERVAGGSAYLRAALAVRYTVSDLISEVYVGSPELAALGLLGLSLLFQTAIMVSPGHFRPVPVPALSPLVTIGTLAGLALAFAAGLPLRRAVPLQARRALCGFALLSLAGLSIAGVVYAVDGTSSVVAGAGYSNDGAVMDYYAANQVLGDHNPYRKAAITVALAALNEPCQTTTPLADGQFRGAIAYPPPAAIDRACLNDLRLRPGIIPPEFESKYNYPSGSFLFILPFVWAGFSDMRFLYLLAVLAMGAYICWRLPRALRVLGPCLIFANVPLVIMTTGGQPDPIYALFVMLAFAEWPSRWTSPLAMGVAVSTKQLSWFFLPFYLVLIARRLGWREATRRAGVVGAIFAATNLPFIIQAPSSYLSSISAPMLDPMFPLGIGLIAVFVANLSTMLPKAAFTAMELTAWLASTAVVARTRRLLPAPAMAALAMLPLFFAWRSLTSYFYLVPLLVAAVLFAERRRQVAGTAALPIAAE